jgi:hypothetical protein
MLVNDERCGRLASQSDQMVISGGFVPFAKVVPATNAAQANKRQDDEKYIEFEAAVAGVPVVAAWRR